MVESSEVLEQAKNCNFDNVNKWLSEKHEDASDYINSILREAAASNRTNIVKELIEAGANPYDEDQHRRTAFNRAASTGLDALAYLTEEAFNDTHRYANPTSFQQMIGNKRRRWTDHDLSTPSGKYDSTLITYAVKVCSAKVVKAMIKDEADIDIVNGSGWNLFHCAAVMPGRKEVLEALVNAFKDKFKIDKNNRLEARSTHKFETTYNTKEVKYAKGLTPSELCQTRIEKEKEDCPKDLQGYLSILNPAILEDARTDRVSKKWDR